MRRAGRLPPPRGPQLGEQSWEAGHGPCRKKTHQNAPHPCPFKKPVLKDTEGRTAGEQWGGGCERF